MGKPNLESLDRYVESLLPAWNVPGMGLAVVSDDEVLFARGYRYRDYGKKLPFTPTTLFQIASNTKLFTAVAAGFLVEEGKLSWDAPVRDASPEIRFHNDQLNNTVTLRDMLSHRTGITRHDSLWFKTGFTRADLFQRIRYLEPRESARTAYLYNNLMYAAVGYLCELRAGRSWEDLVRERILQPLEMADTIYSVADMVKRDDHFVPFTEMRDTTEIHEVPYLEDIAGVAPCGAIISTLEDMTHWLIALLNQGTYRGRQVLPPAVLAATLEPAMALPNFDGETRGFWELLNPAYGMGRMTASYRGHRYTCHGGALPPAFSQVSLMPQERLGVIVFVLGSHCAPLADAVTYNVYEQLLGMDLTPWSERLLRIVREGKKADTEARSRAGVERVAGTRPSHDLGAYVGVYDHPAYGELRVILENGTLHLGFHKIHLPLAHFHYDRFDTPDDEIDGKRTLNFQTNPQGEIDRVVTSLDEGEAVFRRKPEAPDPPTLARLAGTYRTPNGLPIRIALKGDGCLWVALPGQPQDQLIPCGGLKFRITQFSDVRLEFLMEAGAVKALRQVSPSGVYDLVRAEAED